MFLVLLHTQLNATKLTKLCTKLPCSLCFSWFRAIRGARAKMLQVEIEINRANEDVCTTFTNEKTEASKRLDYFQLLPRRYTLL